MHGSRYARFFLLLVLLANTTTDGFAQDCAPGEAFAVLDVNNVEATVYNTGSLFYGSQGTDGYEVPKGSGVHAIFNGGLWFGGMVDGELRMAAQTYAQGRSDYEWFPGPLNYDGTPPDPNECSLYDRIWTITRADIDTYNQTGTATDDLVSWPIDLGAPVVDGDGVAGNYNLAGGDRPELIGDQMAWWIMNDAAGPHNTTQVDPMGMELRVTAYAYDADGPLFNTTFYRFHLTYKPIQVTPSESSENGVSSLDAKSLQETYFGLWFDTDLGNRSDDFIGSDSTRSLAFVYNGDDQDEGESGYGPRPPAVGAAFLDGAKDATGHRRGMSSFISFISSSTVQGSPRSARDYYDYIRGKWRDGWPLTYGGDGFGDDLALGPTNYMYSGHPPAFWSEENTDGHAEDPGRNVPADRWFVMGSGPFTMQPGDEQELTLAIVWSRSQNRLLSVDQLKQDVDAVQAFFEGTNYTPPVYETPLAPTVVSPTPDAVINSNTFGWRPPANQVEGRVFYQLEIATDAEFEEVVSVSSVLGEEQTSLRGGLSGENGKPHYWRVWAQTLGGSAASEARRVVPEVQTRTAAAIAAGGAGIVEVANENGPLAPDAWDAGGAPYAGNTVWHSLNAAGSTKRYYVSGGGGDGGLDRLERYISYAAPHDYEMRFTGDGGYCVYAFEDNTIARVPFELWNIGVNTPSEESDDKRMIPFCLSNVAPGPDWSDTFASGTDPFLGFPISDWLYWMEPHPDDGGYDAFAAVAEDAGGPGALYPEADGSSEGYHAWFTRPGTGFGFVYPIGRFVLADFDGTGVPPPAGTMIRLHTTKPDTLYYDVALSNIFLPEAARSGASANVQITEVTGSGSVNAHVRINGTFTGLEGRFSGLSVGFDPIGDRFPEGISRINPAGVTFEESATAGQFRASLDRLPAFLRIHSQAFPDGEIQGYFVPSPNTAPTTATLEAPANAEYITLSGDGNTSLDIRWQPAADPNANPLFYTWQLAADPAFNDIVFSSSFVIEPRYEVAYQTLDEHLATLGIPMGESATLYHRVISTDGSLHATSPAQTLTLTRGDLIITDTEHSGLPERFVLHGNYPNPFNPVTTVRFDLPEASQVRVEVYDILGRRVLVQGGEYGAGYGRVVEVDGSGLASGVYLYRVEARSLVGRWQETGRMVLVK